MGSPTDATPKETFKILMALLLAAAPADSSAAVQEPRAIEHLDEIRDGISTALPESATQQLHDPKLHDPTGTIPKLAQWWRNFPNFPNFPNFSNYFRNR
jgi:hypothetical protein